MCAGYRWVTVLVIVTVSTTIDDVAVALDISVYGAAMSV